MSAQAEHMHAAAPEAAVPGERAANRPERAASLATRLFGWAVIWTTAILLAGGWTLSSYYVRSVERSFDQRLHVYLKTIVGGVADGTFLRENPGAFGEPRFELPLSGWYWQITRLDLNPPEATTSKSLFEGQLPRLAEPRPSPVAGAREGYVIGPESQRLRLVERIIDLGQDGRYLIAVGGASAEIESDIANFNFALLITFALLGVGLVVTTGFQVGFGLRPLSRIRAQLVEMRLGGRARLEGAFPREIAPLAGELNALIESNRSIVERARTHVGNLAHGLKTPLSVIANEASASGSPSPEKLKEQAELMRRQIDHHLERARLSAGVAFVGETCEMKPTIEALVRAMEKIHRDRDIRLSVSLVDGIRFRGERQDLEEMIGNLVDNACKWAATEVAVTGEHVAESTRGRPAARICVDDDGPGITEVHHAVAKVRGKRLDETKPGSGLGLAIVSELSAMYGGEFTLSRSPLGGLRCELVLPSI